MKRNNLAQKKSTISFILLLFVVFFFASCGKNAQKITLRIPSNPMKTLDPMIWNPQIVLAQGTILEGLFGYDSALNVVPKLAKKTEISKDGRVWTFQLRQDRFWSNGDPVRAQDFVFAWKRFLQPGKKTPMWASMYSYVVHAEDYKNGSVGADKLGFRAVNDYTLEIQLLKPEPLRSYLVLPSALPLNQKSFVSARKSGSEELWWRPDHFIGNGPYVPVEFIRGEKVVLEKNPYYKGVTGNVDRIELLFRGGSLQVQSYQAGFLDFAHVNSQEDYRFVRELGYLKDQITETPAAGFMGFQIARTVHPLFADSNLRRALALAVDKKRLIREALSDKGVATGVFGPPNEKYLQNIETIPYDLDSAKVLIAKSGYLKTKTPFYFFCPPVTDSRGWTPVIESLQKMWQEAGLRVIIQNMENDRLWNYTWGGGFKKGREFVRPGVTMFAGEILWNSPLMRLSLADHVWYWQNYSYPLKKLRKKLENDRLKLQEEKLGGNESDWKKLIQKKSKLKVLLDSIQKIEPDSVFWKYLKDRNPLPGFDSLLNSVPPGFAKEQGIQIYRKAADVLARSEFEIVTYFNNQENLAGFRDIAHLELKRTGEGDELIEKIQQEALKEAWIIPLYSEKLVYLKPHWLHGVVLSKYGNWNQIFLMGNLHVDRKEYFESRNQIH